MDVLKGEGVLHNQRVLLVKVRGVSDDFEWAIANVYGPNVEVDRGVFLNLLANFKSQWSTP